jgi:hypothetical protein
MGHVFARITGFGLIVVPVWPSRVELVAADPAALRISTDAPIDGQPALSAVVRGGDTAVADLGEGVESLGELAEVLRGPDTREWRIETVVYSIGWPAGFAVEPPGDVGGSLFDLHGPDGSLIWIQGPFDRRDLPAVVELAAPGQQLTGVHTGDDLEAVELSYEHDGEGWNQRHYLIPFAGEVLVVTAQAPARHVDLFRLASAEVAASVRPAPPLAAE